MKPKGAKNRPVRGIQITYPANGFQNDVIRLLQKFVATKSIRFSEFTRVWRESNFSLVHLGRNGVREHKEFLDEAFKTLLKYIMPPYNLQVRVGGVYILYSVYYTQRMSQKRRIRMPLSCWRNFCELQQDVIEYQHLDVVYIIRKLISDRVFMLCAYPSMLSVDELYLYDEEFQTASGDSNIAQSSGLGEAPGLLAQIQDEDNIGQLHAVHEKYHQLKCDFNALRGGSADSPGTSLDLIRPDIAKSILGIINRSKTTQPKAVIKSTDTAEDSESSNERAKRLKAIKDGAASAKVTPTLTRKLKTSDAEPVSDNNSNAWVIRKRGRPNRTPPKTKEKPKKSSQRIVDTSTGTDSAGSPAGERRRPRKSEPKKRNTYRTDDNYKPDDKINVVPQRNQPRRRSRSTASIDDDDKATSPEKQTPSKRSRTSSEESSGKSSLQQDEITPDTFVAIRSGRRSGNRPSIGKVVTIKGDDIKVIYYKGDYEEVWTPITAISKDENEGKPLVQPVARKNIIMAGFTLTETGKLPPNVEVALKAD